MNTFRKKGSLVKLFHKNVKKMEELFTKEQIEELNKISKLSEEEQKKVLPDFLKKLSPEQFESLKNVQPPQQCPFCLIVENKIKSKKVYEDKELMAVLEINPSNPGHTLVFPKQHFQILSQVKDVGSLFNLANKISALLFNSLDAQGTNIFVANGEFAGQLIPHVAINVIPRFAKDKLNLVLERKKVTEEELDGILNKIKKNVSVLNPQEEKKPEEVKLKKQETTKTYYQERYP